MKKRKKPVHPLRKEMKRRGWNVQELAIDTQISVTFLYEIMRWEKTPSLFNTLKLHIWSRGNIQLYEFIHDKERRDFIDSKVEILKENYA